MTLEVFQREGIIHGSETVEKGFLPQLLNADVNKHHVAALGNVSRCRMSKIFEELSTYDIYYALCLFFTLQILVMGFSDMFKIIPLAVINGLPFSSCTLTKHPTYIWAKNF